MVSEHASPLAALGGADGGGQNVQVAELAKGLARLGHQVVVHTRRDDPQLPTEVAFADGARVQHVTAGPARPLPKDELLPHMPAFGRRLAEKWTADPPDLVHAHFWMSGLAARRGAAGLGVPLVQTFHALGAVKRRHQGGKDTSPPERIPSESTLGREADLVVATCSDEVEELAAMGVPRQRTAIVPCGTDLTSFTPEGPCAPRGARLRVLSVGRMVERKGIDTAIAAVARLRRVELVVAGGPPAEQWQDDPEAVRLHALAADLGVADRVRFLGPVPHEQVPALHRSADLVVSAPWYEPFGTVPLEAMACAVPPVVTAVGGHLDTVVDGETGVLVPPRDPDALAGGMRRLLEQPFRRAAIGRAGSERVRARYGWDRLAREVATAYRRARLPRTTELTAEAAS